MKIRVVAILLVLIQLSANCFSAVPQFEIEGKDDAKNSLSTSVKVSRSTGLVLAMVNKNLHQQVKILSSLIDFSSALAGKALPKPQNKSKEQNHNNVCIIAANPNAAKRILTPSVIPAKAGIQSSNYFLNDILGSVGCGNNLTLLFFIALLYSSIKRQKFSKLFFLLARGSTEDAIMSLKIFLQNPLWPQVNGDFSCSFMPSLRGASCRSNLVVIEKSRDGRSQRLLCGIIWCYEGGSHVQ